MSNPCSNELPCNGDFECDTDVDSSDAAKFKSDFGRSNMHYPCPECASQVPWCGYNTLSCVEECETELETCLMGCEAWSPDSQYICNDNCIFDYSSNCLPECDDGG
jgi:hypothetical protein